MICKNCNHEIPPGCLFCMNCGAKAEPDGTETGTGSGTQTGPQNEETILNLTRQLQDASARIGYLEQQLDQALQEKQKAEKQAASANVVWGIFFICIFCFVLFYFIFMQ
jgi:outer membrane murein-binding lipoprotein Lpp